jgi:hypothetical protein
MGGRKTVFSFYKSVHHPGTKPNPYTKEIREQVPSMLKQALTNALMRTPAATREKMAVIVNKVVREVGFLALAKIKKACPVGSYRGGLLRNSWNVVNETAFSMTLGTNVAYARYVEEGTRPHIIRARRAKALLIRREKVTRRRR